MKKIEVAVLNPDVITDNERVMIAAGKLTQRSHIISNMKDFMEMYNTNIKTGTVRMFTQLPHVGLQKLGMISVVVVGASRRFLAQITRHQNDVHFMSGSLQYSNYASENNKTDVAIPYAYLKNDKARKIYIEQCNNALDAYSQLVKLENAPWWSYLSVGDSDSSLKPDNDSAGYVMPQGLRNVLIISATPFQWRYMIGLRICRRNTDEMRIVMLKIWEELLKLDPDWFNTVPTFCLEGSCKEGKMTCGHPLLLHKDVPVQSPGAFSSYPTPTEILHADFPNLYT